MNFKAVALAGSAVAFLLGSAYVFAGSLVVGRWGLEPTESVLLLSRRIGVVYLGLSVIFFLARSAPASVTRCALCAGTSVALFSLAGLGIYDLSAGRVGLGMVPSIAVETLLALGYLSVVVADRRLLGRD